MSALLLLVLALLAGAWLLRSARRAAARDRGAQGARAAALEVHRSVPVPNAVQERLACPICLELMRAACRTSCGHSFCGHCLMDVARREPQRPLRCPLDRGAVRYVVPDFALRSLSDEFDDEAGRAAAENERREADDALEAYNERFRGGWCGPCSLAQRLLYFGTSLTWRLFRTLPAAVQVRIALGVLSAALYTLSPIDLLPEAALGPLGLIDDFLAWFIALGLAGEHFRGALQLARRREQ